MKSDHPKLQLISSLAVHFISVDDDLLFCLFTFAVIGVAVSTSLLLFFSFLTIHQRQNIHFHIGYCQLSPPDVFLNLLICSSGSNIIFIHHLIFIFLILVLVIFVLLNRVLFFSVLYIFVFNFDHQQGHHQL